MLAAFGRRWSDIPEAVSVSGAAWLLFSQGHAHCCWAAISGEHGATITRAFSIGAVGSLVGTKLSTTPTATAVSASTIS